jgi:D-lactate dehydrogenase
MHTFVFFDATPEDHKYYSHHLKTDAALVFHTEPLTEQNIALAKDASIVSVHVPSKLTSHVIAALPKLRMVAARTTGYDNIDINATHKAGITVSTVPRYGQNTVAEYTFMLLLALSRKLLPALDQSRMGKIDHTMLTGFDLNGKTLGIIGTGSIGEHVIRIANGFGMPVIGYDPFPNKELENQYNFHYASLNDLLSQSDIVSLHAPYTGNNKHIINNHAFAQMKNGSVLINTSRGELVDTKALVAVLASGKLGGAALDVVEGESFLQLNEETELLFHPSTPNYNYALEQLVLEKMPNVILSPHNAFNSQEALARIGQTTIENIMDFLKGQPTNTI